MQQHAGSPFCPAQPCSSLASVGVSRKKGIFKEGLLKKWEKR